jgi:hypothetical protein
MHACRVRLRVAGRGLPVAVVEHELLLGRVEGQVELLFGPSLSDREVLRSIANVHGSLCAVRVSCPTRLRPVAPLHRSLGMSCFVLEVGM